MAHSQTESKPCPLIHTLYWSSWVAQLVKKPPAMRETWLQPLGWEDPLEQRMATQSHILAQRIPGTV